MVTFFRTLRYSALASVLVLLPAFASEAAPREDPRLTAPGGSEAEILAAFSQASADWGNGIEAVIEDAYRACFRTYILAGKVMTLHLPFAENNERSELTGGSLAVPGGGKADPAGLWERIDAIVASTDFANYVAALSDGREKVIRFDLSARSWSASRDWFSIDQMKAGAYPGLPHQPFVLSNGGGLTAPDIYNYLYSVGRLGMDCSGFVWYVLRSVAKTGGLDLDRALRRYLGAPSAARSSLYFGTWFFDPRNRNLDAIKDEIRNLRPCDVIVFRGEDGSTTHSAIIQSIDMTAGSIRYLQSTDVAEQNDRGVHESFITFDPGRPAASLKDPTLVWHQRRSAPFPGEARADFWDDGQRYRAYPEHGGGVVVRLRALQKLIARVNTAR